LQERISVDDSGTGVSSSYAGYVEIRTSRHPVYYLAEKNLTIPVLQHPGDVPKGKLRTIIPEMDITVEEFNGL
jgi:hypothetical protein